LFFENGWPNSLAIYSQALPHPIALETGPSAELQGLKYYFSSAFKRLVAEGLSLHHLWLLVSAHKALRCRPYVYLLF
jgi:hypothetical protein